jgi:hypothetical protein
MSKTVIEYMGFSDTHDHREYRLRSRCERETHEYTVNIAHADFASGAARYQDGPQISYQKIERALDSAEVMQDRFEMSVAELATYRELHPLAGLWSSRPAKQTPKPADLPVAAASKAEVNEE